MMVGAQLGPVCKPRRNAHAPTYGVSSACMYLRGELPGLVTLRAEDDVLVGVGLADSRHQTDRFSHSVVNNQRAGRRATRGVGGGAGGQRDNKEESTGGIVRSGMIAMVRTAAARNTWRAAEQTVGTHWSFAITF